MTIDTNIHSRYTTLERTLVSFGSRVFLRFADIMKTFII